MAEKVGMSAFESESQMNDYFKNDYPVYYVRPTSSFAQVTVWYDPTSYNTTGYLISDSSVSKIENPAPRPADAVPPNVTRFSETNVQEKNVDEADLIKTDGFYIYYTPLLIYQKNITYVEESRSRYYQYEPYLKTFSIDAMPPESAKVLSEIDKGGDMYLVNDTLIAITDKSMGAFNVSDPENPVQIWNRNLDGNYSESRLVDGKLYLIVQKFNMNGSADVNTTVNPNGSISANSSKTSTSNPLSKDVNDSKEIPWSPPTYMGQKIDYAKCYYPVEPSVMNASSNQVYFISVVNIANGNFDDTLAFVGSNSTFLYASTDNLYLTNYFIPDYFAARDRFFLENGSDYFPEQVMNNYKKELGDGSTEKHRERANRVWDAYINSLNKSLTESEQKELFKNYEAGFSAYIVNLIMTTESTSVSRISLKDFSVTTGTVPGAAANKFFMDEHDGNFRIATTLGTYLRLEDKVNTVYVLDKNMNVAGYTSDLAPGETIKSAAYKDDRLYLVTYKEKDPFFVIDLKNPKSPSVLGELKLPGFSTYLYPVDEKSVIGLGYTDDGKMKLTLFDVTDVKNPKESGSCVFETGKSAALSDSHAFMWDSDRQLLVLPTESHALVMEIKNGKIIFVKDDIHENATVIRSIYINNYLYTFSEKEIHVLDQNHWNLIQKIGIPQPMTFTDPKAS
ncbi:beta-propeller domain-containing protein [Methanolapillus millepedarum]